MAAYDAAQWPPDSVTKRGIYAEAPTDPGFGDDSPTDAGTLPPRAPGQSTHAGTTHATRVEMPAELKQEPTTGRTGPLSLGEPFGPRYHIVRLLGLGGMGAVYQAWDAELGEVVALKVIRPEIAADPNAAAMLERRFKQELVLARQVTHKNVVRIHDLGEIDGIKFLTMPYVEGEELSTTLHRQEKLPIERVMKIARGMASGLEAAHAAGVVHRDLKPANIMVDALGEPVIMDFGIARSAGGPAAVTGQNVEGPIGTKTNFSAGQTMTGAIIGTAKYMAPEQARAEPVDQRADIYAFGLIVYDMLLNRQRADGSKTATEELHARMQAAPPSPRTFDPTIPEPLSRLVGKCLQPDAGKRYQTTPDLVAALDRLDDRGRLRPVYQRVSRSMMAAVAAVVVAMLGLTWWFARGPALPVEHEPVSVVIADFENQTGDAEFDRTLEPVVKLALEGAGFISAYDRNGIARSLGVSPPEMLDEKAAIALAVQQGVGVVLSGTLTRDGSRYVVSMKAAEAVSGNVITSDDERASGRDDVLRTVTNLADGVREALGGDPSDTAQRFAMETLSVTSLDVIRAYGRAMEAMSRSRFNEALDAFGEAVKLDPNFGLAYGGMAIASSNLGRQQDAEKYIKEAMSLVDRMTERERYRTRGLYFFITNDYQACVKEYGDLIARYSADVSARNNRGLCLSQLRDLDSAVDELRHVVQILPNRALYRVNLSIYSAYAGDPRTAIEEANKAIEQSPWAMQALALAQTLQGDLPAARKSYEALGRSEQLSPSYAVSGLADLALYEGRFTDAARILTEGAEADLAAQEPDRAAIKFATLAYTELHRNRNEAAIAAAEKALETSQAMNIRFLAARILVEAGEPAKAKRLAIGLGNDLQAESQAYASIIDGMIAAADGDNRNAIKFLTEANGHLDTWIGHFELGRAYLRADAFTQADAEFDRCLTRRGEALALFLDEEPTFGYFPPIYYYQGRVRDGLRSAGAVESYRAYLGIRGRSTDDPLVSELTKLLAER